MTLARTLARAFPELVVSDDDVDRMTYGRDLWPRNHLLTRVGALGEHRPAAVVWPRTTDEVAALVRWAREARVPIVPFGAGSGVCGGIAPSPETIVVDMKKLTRWRHFDPEAPCVEVEAGQMGLPFEQELERRGFTLGHFPSSILCSTVGGWLAARSAGQCSGRYGKIEDMVVALELVTGTGEVLRLSHRTAGPSLVPLVVGSEGTLGIITSASLRLHGAPATRAFAAWGFDSVDAGWTAMRTLFQNGLRPAVLRLYDPFDGLLARRAGRKDGERHRERDEPRGPRVAPSHLDPRAALGDRLSSAGLRQALVVPGLINGVLDAASSWLGGSLLVAIFEGSPLETASDVQRARALVRELGGRDEGEAPARHWFAHRYAVSYRQAPVFARGAWVDTMEVAATWSSLPHLYEAVRRALGRHAFVMAHFSHAYPDGCCIYFTFVGSAAHRSRTDGWEAASQRTYDAAWRDGLEAALRAGGVLAHHHGIGRSKAPLLQDELGSGTELVRSAKRALDPDGILNPGALLPSGSTPRRSPPKVALHSNPRPIVDRESQIAAIDAGALLTTTQRDLLAHGFTLDFDESSAGLSITVGEWIERGAPGARTPWLDPADHLVAGLEARLSDGEPLFVRPAPRRSVGPDLIALVFGMQRRFASLTRVWLRVFPLDSPRARELTFRHVEPAPSADEEKWFEILAAEAVRKPT